MKLSPKILMFATAFALAGAAATVAAHEDKPDKAQAAMDAKQSGHAGMDMSAGGSGELHQAMMSGMDTSMKMSMTGNVDRDFAMMMIQHHRQALEMAKIEIAKGGNAKLKAMARKMLLAQQKEIKDLEQFTR